MRKLRNIISLIVGFATVFALAAGTARAAESTFAFTPTSTTQGPWVISSLFVESGWSIESYKLDRDIIAWTVRNDAGTLRRLYVNDGAGTRRLAEMPLSVWDRDKDNGFFDAVSGNYDVADGSVVWTMADGSSANDREISKYADGVVTKVTDNTYDDRHPITDAGRIAWTAQPSSAYALMAHDSFGTYQMDAYPVTNYAFSGKNLYWLNKLNGESWFRVFVNDGKVSNAIGQGDDRPIPQYFLTDGKGNATWEYSTKQWDYDKRRIYVSVNGQRAVEVLQRDVPPSITYLEDIEGGTIAVNVNDLLTSMMQDFSVMVGDASTMETKDHENAHTKIRFMDNAYVRHETPENGSTVQVFAFDGGVESISLTAVVHDLFDADGTTAAGVLANNGGVVLYEMDGTKTLVPTSKEARSLDVANGDVAWVEGPAGSGILKFATHGVAVSSAHGAQTVTGTLVKIAGNPAVYLAANDGKRYAFPGQGQFFSWFQNFDGVRTVSAGTLASMPLGGNVLYSPGSRLLKSQTSPRIYAVGANGTLHWIQNADVLASYYGTDWKSRMDTVSDATLMDYSQGYAVAQYSDYHVIQASAK
jgi:hypothetical protein